MTLLTREAGIFNDTMTAIGSIQQVTIPTHNKGNTLDLMFSEASDTVQLEEYIQGQC